MGKRKTIHRKVSKRLNVKNEQSQPETNPFEVHQNRVKHHVIGRKPKNEKGLPGVSRERALKKRKETLLQEYKQRNKSNKFIDRRLGEYKSDMTAEEKMAMRFTFERKKKKNIFNLNDDDELTHYGHSLAEIEKFEDPRSDEDEDEDQTVGEFMKESSFGGLLTLKRSSADDDEKPKSRKDWIEELIMLSKQKKHERQTDKEEAFELTEKLDNEWKDIRSVLNSKKKPELPPAKNQDSYDLLVRSLQYESKAKATDRLKTEEELAQEEKEKLEEMERERIRRMNETTGEGARSISKSTHRSADDLDDNFYVEGTQEKKVRFLEYVDGKLMPSDEESDQAPKDVDSVSESSSVKAADSENAEDEEGGDDDDESDAGSNDNFSDLDSLDGGGGDDVNSEDDDSDKEDGGEQERPNDDEDGGDVEDGDLCPPSTSIKMQMKQLSLEASEKKEIPYVLPAPDKYEDFLQLTDGHSADDVLIIIERLQKYYHASLAEGNKQKLEILFAILLQYVNDISSPPDPQLHLIDKLVPHLYKLAVASPGNATQCMKELLKEKYTEFDRGIRSFLSGMRASWPELDTIIFFKLVSCLFSTSDYRHPVVSPAMLFMGQILSQCRTKTRQDVARGMFICNLFLEYVSFSKNYAPEAICFLRGIVSLAADNDPSKPLPVPPPFRKMGCPFLKLEKSARDQAPPFKLGMKMMVEDGEITDEFRLTVVWLACKLILKFACLYDALPSFRAIFLPVLEWCRRLPLEMYPEDVEEIVNRLKQMVEKERRLEPLRTKKKGPAALPLLNPRIEENFRADRKQKKGKGQNSERQKLLYKIKRETKGAMREIRRDNQFLAKQQLDERLQRDSERKKKVKELYQSLAGQEGDYKALMKKKRKLK